MPFPTATDVIEATMLAIDSSDEPDLSTCALRTLRIRLI